MTNWQWWAQNLFGDETDAEIYSIGPEPTREAVIASALRETVAGERFAIIEARSSEDMRHEGADCVPFLRTRGKQVLVNGAAALASLNYFTALRKNIVSPYCIMD